MVDSNDEQSEAYEDKVNFDSPSSLADIEIDPTAIRLPLAPNCRGARQAWIAHRPCNNALPLWRAKITDRLLAFDMRTMKVTATFDVGGGQDVLASDPESDTVYVAGEKGIVSTFSVSGSEISKIGDGEVGPNAHAVEVDAEAGFIGAVGTRKRKFPFRPSALRSNRDGPWRFHWRYTGPVRDFLPCGMLAVGWALAPRD
ncbi:hypothetical protein LMG28727_06582 [Paraburkholderia kirstenboschensis]|nr:hypothetical protein LMG28727_06582 [Paraburkholderia kirstenboschensis]